MCKYTSTIKKLYKLKNRDYINAKLNISDLCIKYYEFLKLFSSLIVHSKNKGKDKKLDIRKRNRRERQRKRDETKQQEIKQQRVGEEQIKKKNIK